MEGLVVALVIAAFGIWLLSPSRDRRSRDAVRYSSRNRDRRRRNRH